MASAKIISLAIRTVAKPIATQLKHQAAQHESFKRMRLRSNLLSTGDVKIRPLNDAKAIANGANAISEGFLFLVAVLVIVAETYRGSRNRANVHDRLDTEIKELRQRLDEFINAAKDQPTLSIADRARTPFDSPHQDEYERLARSVSALWAIAEKNGLTPTAEELAEELRKTLSAGNDTPEIEADELVVTSEKNSSSDPTK
ncbi:hypothetical protein MCUN1_000030 [Malassezia cuniculi]|uniref:OPA3-like protein n=1 Tax=Malassezia cuniculi TaxID=948313 RepID=A0AAF0EUI7_9BASI|nr:hypothetical protein MCUN1_000030 [Malassezia cuniculi]